MRIFSKKEVMKGRLNLIVDELLMKQVKRYAEKHSTSVSQLVEDFFKTLTRPAGKKNAIEPMKTMPKPTTTAPLSPAELKEDFYISRKDKYGF